jgi:hypothetical protein
MFRHWSIGAWAILGLTIGIAHAESATPFAVVCAKNASSAEILAGKEVRRYVYLRTDTLLPILADPTTNADDAWIVVGSKDQPTVQSLLSDDELKTRVDGLAAEQYVLKTVQQNGRTVLLIVGGDAVGTLYGAYRFAEHLGIRFYLDGDIVPDEQVPLELPDLDETGKPLFATRGILPFHDFPEGPDLWNLDDYRAVLAQLAKLRMNFIGLHTYSECGWGSEPTVWIGAPDDVAADGSVRDSYPAHYFNTARSTSGHAAKKTGEFGFGAAQLFADDPFGPDVMQGLMPWGKSADQRNELFRRTGELLRETFRSAHALGIKTCVGTEMPLLQYAPKELKERLAAQGKDLADPAVLRELYRGVFTRIMKTHPLDYYWLWTPESWRTGAVADENAAATERDLLAAVAAAEDVAVPFTLATAGWTLGPNKDRTLYDQILPKRMPFSCINLELGTVPVDPAFAKLKDRPKWAIPWLEDDLSMSTPESWVGRIRRDASDAYRYGCTGLMGIHWRTRDVGPEVAALAAAGWEQGGWGAVGTKDRSADQIVEVDGGQTASFDAPVADTEASQLYQTVRYDMSAYRVRLPNGTYTITLQFCEPFYSEANQRAFGVTLQGKTVIEQLDIFAKVGRNRALDYTFSDIPVTDGRLEIGFLKDCTSQFMKEAEEVGPKGLKEFPCLATFVVEGPGKLVKVNCGGSAYGDYQAEPVFEQTRRFAPAGDFFLDWATHQFGPKAAKPIAEIFERIDGCLPTPAPQCPGGILPDGRPWTEAEKSYAFVDDLARLQPEIVGIGNRDRFDYWFKSFCYLKATGRVACRIAELDRAMDQVSRESDPAKKKVLARQVALPLRLQLLDDWGQMVTLLLETVGTWGEIGTVLTHEMYNMQELRHLNRHDQAIEQILGESLPPMAYPWPEYRGPDRIILPTTRTSLQVGEDLKLRLMLLSNKPPKAVSLYWRPLGSSQFTIVPFQHQARGAYAAVLPAQSIGDADLEYHVRVETGDTKTLCYPSTAPLRNQTVILAP